MATSLVQSRALSGCRAFQPARVSTAQPRQVLVASKRNDSFMVETNVGEEEPEDFAVRRFMTSVIDCKFLDELRWRRYKETNQERYKRRTKERHEIRKLRIVQPTWDDLYGYDAGDPNVFESHFKGGDGDDTDDIFGEANVAQSSDLFNDLTYAGDNMQGTGAFGNYMGGTQQGGYMTNPGQGGYMTGGQGGYMNPNQGGGYMAGSQGANYQDGQDQAGSYTWGQTQPQQQAGYFAAPAGEQQQQAPPADQGGYFTQPSGY